MAATRKIHPSELAEQAIIRAASNFNLCRIRPGYSIRPEPHTSIAAAREAAQGEPRFLIYALHNGRSVLVPAAFAA